MSVVDRSTAGFQASRPTLGIDRTGQVVPLRLAVAFTYAAAVAGLLEILFDRIFAPALAGVLGSTTASATAVVTTLGITAVSATAVLVLLAITAWSAHLWSRNPLFAAAALTAAAGSVLAGLSNSGFAVGVVQASVAVGVVVFLSMTSRRHSILHLGAVWAVALAVLAGQWTLRGLGNGHALGVRALREGALVLAVVLLASNVLRSRASGRIPLFGLGAGAAVAAALLMVDYTPLVALFATGATLWLPSMVYVVAASAVGFLLASSISNRACRPLVAAVGLLLVAGLEPALVHHNVTALLALVTLGSAVERGASWH